ncbi:MAG: GNAT family N-acetyltransferase [Deltaproteobacteria bacterium]|nr:GNAT family N-acetyltransferase [Deltaproteobacteria bacterium]
MTGPAITIRHATAADEGALGHLGAELLRLHHGFDAERFMAPGPNTEEGYGRFLAAAHANDDTLVLVAERAGEIVGYCFAGIEPRSWKELRDRAGFVHDVLVVEGARGTGTGERLVEAAAEWLLARGVARVMLWTAEKNVHAQRLFERLGFRRTMIEMTR